MLQLLRCIVKWSLFNMFCWCIHVKNNFQNFHEFNLMKIHDELIALKQLNQRKTLKNLLDQHLVSKHTGFRRKSGKFCTSETFVFIPFYSFVCLVFIFSSSPHWRTFDSKRKYGQSVRYGQSGESEFELSVKAIE